MHTVRWTCAVLFVVGVPAAGHAAASAQAAGVGAPMMLAADAAHPYSNIDHSNDAGNDTGDSQVETLNQQQLDENYQGPYYYGRPPPPGVRPPSRPPAYAARPLPPLRPGYPLPGYSVQPAYPPPPPGYYPPPGY